MMMKNTIAKLLAEEDIFVVHKQMDTAYFDVKNRELGLPIWKENTMEAVEEELLVCHEIGHALYTPLDMLENSQLRKIDSSVVNVLEDARIEKKVKNKYLVRFVSSTLVTSPSSRKIFSERLVKTCLTST